MNILIREWKRQKYHDPKEVLIKFREIEMGQSIQALPVKIRALRTNKLKKHKEGREIALFCYGLSHLLKTKVYFARLEQADHDFVTCWRNNDEIVYTPVQLKEVTPDRINPTSTLQTEINKLSKYASCEDLVVAIFLNKRCKTDFSKIIIPKLNIAELWVFGSFSPDQSKWFIYGNILGTPQFCEFEYPGVLRHEKYSLKICT